MTSPWAAMTAQLAEAGDRLTALMEKRGEAPGNVDVYLTMLGALMDGYLNRVCGDSRFPAFVPCAGYFQHLGSPSPDTVYRRAPVDDTGIYRLSGERGTAWQVTITHFEEPAMRSGPPFDLSDVTGPDGQFDVIVSRERPKDYAGAWWPLPPGTGSLWLRSTSDRWGQETEPRIAITRADAPRRPRTSAREIRAALGRLGTAVERIVEYGISHADQLAADGVVNTLKLADYTTQGGGTLQWYHEGVFTLDENEALLVEARLPADCRYLSWSLTDRMLVTLDWTHAQTSLNRSQATVDDDGVLRAVVAGADPGIRNWLDTTGYQSGVLQCRAIGSAQPPVITARRCSLGSVAAALPAGTARLGPQERAEALRVRRTGAQLRSLW
jgi:hypothetical protein